MKVSYEENTNQCVLKNERENYREHTNAVDKSLYSNESSRSKRLVIRESTNREITLLAPYQAVIFNKP